MPSDKFCQLKSLQKKLQSRKQRLKNLSKNQLKSLQKKLRLTAKTKSHPQRINNP